MPKFGMGQFGQATPAYINNLFDCISAILGIIAMFFTTAAFISHNVSDIVTAFINGLLVPLCPVVKRMFGVPIDTPKVNADSVDVIDTNKKP